MTHKYSYRSAGIRDLANILIRDNIIRIEGANFFESCKNNDIMTQLNSLVFMTELMEKCEEKQEKDVLWLFDEWMPPLIPFLSEMLYSAKIRMHLRFSNVRKISDTVEVLAKRWKKQGKLRDDYFCHDLFKS